MSRGPESRDQSSDANLLSALGATAAIVGRYVDPAIVAALLPQVRVAIDRFIAWRGDRGRARCETVLALGAVGARLDPTEMVERLANTPEGEELLFRALVAAQDAAVEAKLEAIGSSLASGALASSKETVRAESLFNRTMSELDSAHIRMLEQFSRSARDLKLGDGEVPVPSLSDVQLRMVLPEFADTVEPVLAVLERNGLVLGREVGSTAFSGGSAPNFTLTSFGQLFLRRLHLVSDEALAREKL